MRTSLVPVLALGALASCAGMPLYPPRPAAATNLPTVEPAPSKVVVHISLTPEGLSKALDEVLPSGSAATLMQGKLAWSWQRTPIAFRAQDGKLQGKAAVTVGANLPVLGRQTLAFDLTLSGEPVIGSDYKLRLQSPKVDIVARDMKVQVADLVGNSLGALRQELQKAIESYTYDLSPKVLETWGQVTRPVELPVGDAKGCLALRISGFEAGPTVLAGGFEKDVAIIVAPSVTLPCNAPPTPAAPPPLANVAALPTGPFTVTVPVAAAYSELAKAMTMAFTDGKLFFTKDHPELYLADPEIYAAQGQLVLKLHLGGAVTAGSFSTTLNGDIFFAGHPAVVDNELQIPDLQPTVETGDFLLKLKANLDKDNIRDQARQALRLDLGARMADARARVSGDRSFGVGCLRSDVSRIEVTGIYPHAGYLRVYVAVTAQAALYVPCPGQPPSDKPEEKPAEKPIADSTPAK